MAAKITIGVVGSNDEDAVANAFLLGELIAAQGWVVISGGRNEGVMKAVNAGAKKVSPSITVGILPTARSDASPNVDIVIKSDLNNARNNIIGLSSCVLVACGVGGAGTASEIALALKNGKHVILLCASTEALSFFRSLKPGQVHEADSPEAVIQCIIENMGKWCK